MKIIIDLQSLQGISCNRGIGRYSFSLTKELVRQASNHEVYLLLNSNLPKQIEAIRRSFDSLIPQDRIKIFDVPQKISGHDFANTWRIKAAEKIREHFINNLSPDIVFITSPFEGWIDDAPISIGELQSNHLTTATLYDLIPFIYPDLYIKDFAAPNFFFQKMQYLKKSNLLITLSESASQEASYYLTFPREKIVNCSAGLDEKFKIVDTNKEDFFKIKNKYGIIRNFILYVGGIDHRKNANGLIEAFSLLPFRRKFQLVIIVSINDESVEYFSNLFKTRFKLDSDELILIRYVPEDILITLYNTCSLFVFPSFHEGFGLPILEAMACGAPVITSNMTSIPEVTGCQEALFDPKKPISIVNKIIEVLTNNDFKTYLKQHGQKQIKKFTWESSAKKVLSAFEYLYESKNTKKQWRISCRKKLAYLSPLSPEKTGLADYNTLLIRELACFYEIILITDQTDVDDVWLTANFQIHDTKWFTQQATTFDIILYEFCNSPLHHYMLDLLNIYPGIVILHDFFLSELLDWIDNFIPNKKFIFNHALYYSHGFQALVYHEKNGRKNTYHTYPCNLSVFKQAIGVIFHSQQILDLTNKWYGSHLHKKINIINYILFCHKKNSEEDKNKTKQKLGFNTENFIISAFGNIKPNKLNHRLIKCCLNIIKENKNIYLIFIGKTPSSNYYKNLLTIINKHKLQEKIKFKGFTNKNLFKEYLLATDIAVQLRTNSKGETSDCLLTCLSYGIPTIANAHENVKEFPNNVLLKLEDNFSDHELSDAIIRLYSDIMLRNNISKKALEYISENHNPVKIGNQFNRAIEKFYHTNNISESTLIKDLIIDKTHLIKEGDLLNIAKIIASNRPSISYPQLYVDITNFVENSIQTGNQIYTEIFKKIMNTYCLKLRIEPIYYNRDKKKFFYARKFTTLFLALSPNKLIDTPIDIFSNDIFFSLFPTNLDHDTDYKKIIDNLKIKDIKVYIFILEKDIPPINYLYEVAEACICLKKEYVNSLINFFHFSKLKRDIPIKIGFLDQNNSNEIVDKILNIIQYKLWIIEWNSNMIIEQNIPSVIKEISINKIKYTFEGDTRYLGGAHHEFDITLLSIFKSFCYENSHVLDLGANIGLTAVALADVCHKGKVSAVEPLPPSFEFLKKNIKNAKKNNISLHNFAVGNMSGEISMQATNDFLAGAFIADKFQADNRHFTMKVKLEPLDKIFDQFNFDKLDFIKMDLEGYEIVALEGAKEILEKYKPTVCLEMNHWCLNVFHRITLPEFQERLCKLFPYIYAIEYPNYLDFTTTDNFYHIAHEHVTTTYKYFNLIAGFNRAEIIKNLSLMVNHIKNFSNYQVI